jgi:hypothetical protein
MKLYSQALHNFLGIPPIEMPAEELCPHVLGKRPEGFWRWVEPHTQALLALTMPLELCELFSLSEPLEALHCSK